MILTSVSWVVVMAQHIDSLFTHVINTEQLVDSTNEQRFNYSFFQGVNYTQKNQLDSALFCFNRCLSLDDHNPVVYFEISKLYHYQMQSDKGFEYLQKAIDLAPNDVYYREVQIAYYVEQKRYDEAIKGYQTLLKRKPNSEKYLYNLYDLYALTKQYAKQLVILDRLEELTGVSETLSFEKLGVLLQLKNRNRVEPEILKLIKKFPRESQYVVLLGDFYREFGKEKKGLNCYQQVLAADSTDGHGLMAMASYYNDKNQSDKANVLMLKALKDKRLPLENKLKWLRSYVVDLVQTNQTQRIDSLFALLFTLYPDEESIIQLHLDYLVHTKNYPEAIEQQRRLLNIDPTKEEYWQSLLQLEVVNYQPETILEVVTQAIQYFPTSPAWYYQKAGAEIQLTRFDDALQTIDTVLTFTDALDKRIKSMFLALKGDVYVALKNYKQAFEWYDQSLEIDPKNALVLNNYAYFLSLTTNGDLRKAERMSSMAVESDPKNATYLDTYAWVLFMRGDYSLAKFYQQRAIDITDKEPTILEHFGDILFQLGDLDGALNYWQKALDAGSESDILKQKITQKQYIPELILSTDYEKK